MTPSENIRRLAPFLLRSRSLEVGRDRLLQVRKKLLFLLATEDLSDNSLKKTLLQFDCPVVQCFRSSDLEELFRLYGTKLIGFRRSSLTAGILKELSPFRLHPRKEGLPPRPLPPHPTVAILGIHGIGRHHAFWWNQEGANVTAFLCRSQEHIPQYQNMLQETFSFQGTGFCRLEDLLGNARPDIVDVCLPDALHEEAVRASLEAGCHVLCEKPFVYDPALSAEELLQQADALNELARNRRCLLGICSQYATAIRKCLNLRKDQSRNPDYLDMQIISPGRPHSGSATDSWFDIGTHCLAAAQICARPGILAPEDFIFTQSGNAVIAEFTCRRPDSDRLFRGRLTTEYHPDPPQSLRRIRLDQEQFTLESVIAANGLLRMQIQGNTETLLSEDPLQLLIRSFLKNRLEFPAEAAIQNLSLLLSAR